MDWQPVLEKFKLVQRNPVFRTLSSVRLAIPVMGTLGVVVAWGTILESRYGAAYAKLAVYEQNWFWGLIGLIWLNVLFAALSRIPYKKQHTGFVITHLGILILLAGSFVTGKWGIDGSLRIVEGGQGNHVQLPSLVLEVAGDDIYRKVEIQKSLWPQEVSDLTSHNDELRGRLRLFRYLPFAKMESGMEASVEADAGVAVGFLMKSPFFQVSEWLHETERPVYRMGPAVLRLVTSEASSAPTQVSARANPVNSPKQRVTKVAPGAAKVLIRSATDGKVVKTLTVGEFKKGPVKINGVEVSLVNVFQRAVVSDNRLAESEEGKENPALELKLYSEGKASREVVYGLFPQFSLHPNGAFGLRFEYQIPDDVFPTEEKEDSQLPEGHVPVSSAAGNPGESNVIEFIVPKEGEQLVLRLLKNGEEVLRQQVSAGQSVQTPGWA